MGQDEEKVNAKKITEKKTKKTAQEKHLSINPSQPPMAAFSLAQFSE
jgi:hypothetical protein